MSEFNLIWRKYGLRANPYFNSPLTIDGGTLPISAFIGRENEQQQLRSAIKLGGEVRCLIVGDPGVGKTSLVNYVRSQAAKNGFFTPSREIEINRVISGNEFIILTLSSIFDEIKRRDIQLPEHLHDQLDAFYMLNSYGENFMEVVNTSQLNRQKLISLFQNVVKELVNPRFKGLILHYDNLDNIEDDEGIVDMFSDIRDFLLTKDIVFFFVGDHYTAPLIPVKDRVNSIFLKPEIEVPPLSNQEVLDVLETRIKELALGAIPVISPHTNESVDVLFKLYNGNIREILNGLQNCVIELAASNSPLQITPDILRDTLYEKSKTRLLKLTQAEKILFKAIEDLEEFTPTELAKISKKNLQNISSKYIPSLMKKGVIRFKGREGRNSYYGITSEMKWLKLHRTKKEQERSKSKLKKEIIGKLQSKLKDFFE